MDTTILDSDDALYFLWVEESYCPLFRASKSEVSIISRVEVGDGQTDNLLIIFIAYYRLSMVKYNKNIKENQLSK